MSNRADELIALLQLEPHVEGGYFRRDFCADGKVQPLDGRGTRHGFSSIYYLLTEGTHSRWHRVLSDEAWHYYEGAPLALLMVPPVGGDVVQVALGPVSVHARPQHVVPAGWWQAAYTLGEFTLAGCSLGPAFDYADFVLLADVAMDARPAIMPFEFLDRFL